MTRAERGDAAGCAPITVLTSAVGYGTYIPALLNERALRTLGIAADVEVIEGWFSAPQRARHLAHKAAFHGDFRLALLANRIPRNVHDSLDEPRIEALLARWAREERRRFIVWSGFWFPVLERYLARVPHLTVEVDLCRIDAVVSASFRIQRPLLAARSRDIWLWNWQERRLGWCIPVDAGPPLAYEARDRRLVVHGGGWALGTYAEVLPELARTDFALDVLAPETASASLARGARDRHFAPPSDWHPWQRGGNAERLFPPLCELLSDGSRRALPNDRFHPAHTLVREARAVVSKPGGGTLIDSLAAATPVVLLAPYGEAEARSADLWEHLGFGIRYERWRDAGFDAALLARLHQNLVDAAPQRSLPRYPDLAWAGGSSHPSMSPRDGARSSPAHAPHGEAT